MIYNNDCFDISQYKKLERGNVLSGFLGKSVFFVRETTRDNCTSHRNAIVVVILLDKGAAYCCYDENSLFPILKSNIENGYTYIVT